MADQRSLKRKIAIIAGVVLGVCFCAWLLIAAYVSTHKKQLLAAISRQLNESLNGRLTIESMEPALIRGFPGISVELKNVLLRDSLWSRHRHNLLKASTVFIAVDAFSIPGGDPVIKNITINNGEIYLFTDSSGYTNTSLFKHGGNAEVRDNKHKKINRIILNRVSLTLENLQKDKLHNFSIEHFSSKIKYKSDSWSAEMAFRMRVNSLAFRKQKGSYLKNKMLDASLKMSYDHKAHVLSVPVQPVKIGRNRMKAGGEFAFGEGNNDFTLRVSGDNILYSDAASMLPPPVGSKLRRYGLKKPIAVNALIRGKLEQGNIPLINVTWRVKNNVLRVNNESFTDCSFSGSFTNELVRGKARTDPNSVVNLFGMDAKWHGIPFTSDTIHVVNLKEPVLTGKIRSRFSLNKLNSVTGARTFAFSSGTADVNLLYKASYKQGNASEPYFSGFVKIEDADITYVPRSLDFKNTSLLINFNGSDLFFRNVRLQSGSSSLSMQGSVKNFVNLYYSDPAKIVLDWKIHSPQINLTEFLSFLGKRKRASGGEPGRFFNQLDRVLDEASVHMNMNVDRLVYKKFTAAGIHSDITLKQNDISIRDISLSHAGGRLELRGNIDQSGVNNLVDIESSLRNVNVQQLFNAFGNFGQDAITAENIRGSLTARTRVHAAMQRDGQMVPYSFFGYVNFDLQSGALVNFEPMQKIGQFAFPNRNFSNITISSLKNTLDIQGNKIIIRPMLIQSSVLNVFIEGVYGIPSGTDIAMRVPLRNPKRDEFADEKTRERNITKGLIINLKAVDGDDGNVKIKMGKSDAEGPRIEKKAPVQVEPGTHVSRSTVVPR